jgi:xylulokinase
VILTIDLGTSVTKAALWTDATMVSMGRAPLTTEHPAPNWAEQDAGSWWDSVVAAVRRLGAGHEVAVVAFAAARRTFVPVRADGAALGPAILWSDTRCGSGSVPPKLRWLEANQPDRLEAARWLLSPRDLVVWRMTGEVHTDWTLASASGAYAVDGSVVDEAAPFASMLPEPVASTTVAGGLLPEPAEVLGMRAGIPVVIGAGDRQCEVLGTRASAETPMVSWGTTANVSMPVDSAPMVPAGLRATRGALGGWLLEGGVSAAGSLLEWLSGLASSTVETLLAEAEDSPPGARGVVALPWLGGARAPWWREDVGAAFLGLGPGHRRGDLARAAVEGVAFEIGRCLESGRAERLVLAGGGAASPLWSSVLGAVTGLPVLRRRSSEAASVGAAVLAASALPATVAYDVDAVNPVVAESAPEQSAVEGYRAVREVSDRSARAFLDAVPVTPGGGTRP